MSRCRIRWQEEPNAGAEVVELKTEQSDDDAQMAFCEKDLAKSEATQKNLETSIASSEALIEETKEASAAASDEIASLQKEIKALDKAVAEASDVAGLAGSGGSFVPF